MSFSVLVLDDEPWQLSWVEDLVRAKGGECTFTRAYDEAVGAFSQKNPDIVVVDIRIGDVDEPLVGATLESANSEWVGLRFVAHIRVKQKSVKTRIFVYTGLDREDLERIVVDTYNGAFFTKFEAADFRAALLRAISAVTGDGA